MNINNITIRRIVNGYVLAVWRPQDPAIPGQQEEYAFPTWADATVWLEQEGFVTKESEE